MGGGNQHVEDADDCADKILDTHQNHHRQIRQHQLVSVRYIYCTVDAMRNSYYHNPDSGTASHLRGHQNLHDFTN